MFYITDPIVCSGGKHYGKSVLRDTNYLSSIISVDLVCTIIQSENAPHRSEPIFPTNLSQFKIHGIPPMEKLGGIIYTKVPYISLDYFQYLL